MLTLGFRVMQEHAVPVGTFVILQLLALHAALQAALGKSSGTLAMAAAVRKNTLDPP